MAALPPLRSLPMSDRVELRHHVPGDLELIRRASADDLIPLITTVPTEWSEEAGLAYLDRQVGRPAEGVGWSLAIVDRATDTAVGNLYLSLLLRELGAAEIGYWIAEPYRSQGFAAEALRLVRDWAPIEFGLDRLTLYIDPENLASLRTAERSDFRREAEFAAWERVGDELRPMTVWGIGDGPERSHLGVLEHRMWRLGYRDDRRWFDHHLAGDFFEHGCSGKLWTRPEIVDQQIGEIEVEFPLSNLTLDQIDERSWLLTYLSRQPHRVCRRASLWQCQAQGWRLRFHQGTPVPEG